MHDLLVSARQLEAQLIWMGINWMTNIPVRSPEEFLVFGAPVIEAAEIEEAIAAVGYPAA